MAVKLITTQDELTERLLENRGVKTKEEKERFFNPKLSDYEKDLEIPGIEKAIAIARKRIMEAVINKELIIAYGDYDVDGICGTAVLYLGLISVGARVLPYIPHREKEGFGLSEDGLRFAKDQGAKLIVTVDNGISAVSKSRMAKKIGLDLIITDHHLIGGKKPEALSIIHSTKICGAAVGWCLIRKLVSRETAEDLLDLVGMATICDMMPLLGVNRALAKTGLEKLRKTKKVGLRALINQAKINPLEISAFHVGYMLGPRLNAKGRLEHAMDSLRLLCTKDAGKANKLAKMLGETNDIRKELVSCAVAEAREMVFDKDQKIIVLDSKNWIPGITGLIAGKIREEYGVPSIIISSADGVSKGSARSVKGVDIFSVMKKCAHLLMDVGGHPGAAGFTIETQKIELFRENLIKVMDEIKLNRDDKIEVEIEAALPRVGKNWVTVLEKFEPFGIGNPRPAFLSRGVALSNIKTVGSGQHLKFKADDVDAIAFSFGEKIAGLQEGQKASIVYNLEIDKFSGADKLQLRVIDLYELSRNTTSQKSV